MTKVTVKKPNKTYPWVGVNEKNHERTIVYFIGKDRGLCLSSTVKEYELTMLTVKSNWNEHNFEPCTVTIRSK